VEITNFKSIKIIGLHRGLIIVCLILNLYLHKIKLEVIELEMGILINYGEEVQSNIVLLISIMDVQEHQMVIIILILFSALN
jgi:hypothetical protein